MITLFDTAGNRKYLNPEERERQDLRYSFLDCRKSCPFCTTPKFSRPLPLNTKNEKMAKKKIKVQGVEIRLLKDNSDYICLTDIVKGFEDEEDDRNRDFLILNWLRNGNTIIFLGEWEKAHNTDFNPVEFDRIKMDSNVNSFRISGVIEQKANLFHN